MAVAQLELRPNNSSRKTSRSKTSRKGNGASRDDAARKDGAARLRWAADKRVGRNSEKLADLLTEKALNGDLASTKILVSLATGKKPVAEPVKKRHGPSFADRLAAEPEWREDSEQ
jgi:hypothetical protein